VGMQVGGGDEMKKLGFLLLCLMVFSVPFECSLIWEQGATASRIFGYVAVVGGLVAIGWRGSIRPPTGLHFLLLAIVFYSALSLLWSVDEAATLQSLEARLRLFGMVLLIWELALENSSVEWLMRSYVAGGCVGIAGTIQNFISGQVAYEGRYMSDGFDPNDLALTLVVSIPLAWYLSTRTRSIWRAALYYVYIVAVLFAVALTASRGGALAAGISLAVIPFSWKRQNRSKKFLITALLIFIVTAGIGYVPESSWARLGSIGEEIQGGTMNSRTAIWMAGEKEFREHPFFGVGGGAFSSAVAAEIPDGSVAHNSFLSLMVEYGVAGTLLALTVLVELVRLIYRMQRNEKVVWAVCFTALAAGMFGLSWLECKPPWLALGIALAHVFATSPRPISSRVRVPMTAQMHLAENI